MQQTIAAAENAFPLPAQVWISYEETRCCTYGPRAQASLDPAHPSAKSRAKVLIQLHFALVHPGVKGSFGCEPVKLQVFCFQKMDEEGKTLSNSWVF